MRSKIILSAFVFLLIGAASGRAQSDQSVGKPDASQAKQAPAQAQTPSKSGEQSQPPNVQLPQDKPFGAA
ncbi:MAG: hypothetical protein AAB401_14735, partial [Acidobacteriota bacterium]